MAEPGIEGLLTAIKSDLEEYNAKASAIIDAQKEPHLHINLPDLTGLEDKFQKILRHIADIDRQKASADDVRTLCNKVLAYLESSVAGKLISEFGTLADKVDNSAKRIEDEILRNVRLRMTNIFLGMALAFAAVIFIAAPSTSRKERHNAEKCRIMRSYFRDTDTSYDYLDRIYSTRDRKAIRAQRDSLAARINRMNQGTHKSE